MLAPLIVFDLDDTLYLERDFARSGFAAAGDWLYRESGVHGLAETCLTLFANGLRGRIFDEALIQLGVPADPLLLSGLIEIYRSHRPAIHLAADTERYLATHSRPVALVTDGPSATQARKVRALGLAPRLGYSVYTGALGPGFGKPHPHAFQLVETWAARFGGPLVYVADNPLKDFVAPRARGWLTVQIERPERVHRVEAPDAAHEAHVRIESLDHLDDRLDRVLTVASRPCARADRYSG